MLFIDNKDYVLFCSDLLTLGSLIFHLLISRLLVNMLSSIKYHCSETSCPVISDSLLPQHHLHLPS